MTNFFLGCFAFGLIFTVASFLLGAFGGHLHLGGVHFHGAGHGVGHGAGHGGGGAGHHGSGGVHISPFNISTISAFLAWFGGAGYLMSRFSTFTGFGITLVATAAGLAGGGIVFLTLSKLLLPRLTEMRPEDYRVEGTVARITMPIRVGGTGEIVYQLGGTQKIEGARSLSGEAMEKGTEVLIHHVDAGIAYVERWDKFAEQNALPPGSPGPA